MTLHVPAFAVPAFAMPTKRSSREFFRQGREKGSEQCQEGVNDLTVLEKPMDKVLKIPTHDCPLESVRFMQLLFFAAVLRTLCPFRYAEDHPKISPYDLTTLGDFVKEIAFGFDGAEDDANPGRRNRHSVLEAVHGRLTLCI